MRSVLPCLKNQIAFVLLFSYPPVTEGDTMLGSLFFLDGGKFYLRQILMLQKHYI